MATKIPLRATFDGSNNPTGIAEFQTNEFVPVSHGGTGLGTYSDNQILVGNTSNTLVPKTLTAGTGITITSGSNTMELSASIDVPSATPTVIGGITVQASSTSGLTLGIGEIDTHTTNANGSGYSLNDRLKINSGDKNSILQPSNLTGSGLALTTNMLQKGSGYSSTGSGVATLTAGSVTGVSIANGGTNYSNATEVATTGTYGTGLTVDITVTSGEITGITVNKGGSGYFVGDTISVSGGDSNATFTVSTVTGGIVVSGSIATAGSNYTQGTNQNTTGGNGTGLTVNTTVSGTSITAIDVSYGGSGYLVNDVITVSGGNTDATFTITEVKGNGSGYTVDFTANQAGDLVHAKQTDAAIQVGPGSGNNNVISYINVDKYGHISGSIDTKTISIDAQADAVAMAIALG